MKYIASTILAVFITAALTLIFLPIVLAVVIIRQILNAYLKTFENGRYILMNPMDGLCGVEIPPKNVGYTITFFSKRKTPFNSKSLETMRAKVVEVISTSKYRRMKCRPCLKWGFLCWKDFGTDKNSFDICNHVKLCPGADDFEKVYSETEMTACIQQRVNVDMEAKVKPLWELLVIPQVRKTSSTSRKTDSPQMAVIFRVNHGYMDAHSFKEFLRQGVFDDEEAYEIEKDLSKTSSGWVVTFVLKVLATLYGFFFQTRCAIYYYNNDIPNIGNKDTHFVSLMTVQRGKMGKIRAAFKVDSLAVFTSALIAAIHKLAARKRIEIPTSINTAITAQVGIPPLSDTPRNHFSMYRRSIPVNSADIVKNLNRINKKVVVRPSDSWELLGFFRVLEVSGLFPESWIRFIMKGASMNSVAVTAYPMSENVFRFQDNEVTSIFCNLRPAYGTGNENYIIFFDFLFTISLLNKYRGSFNSLYIIWLYIGCGILWRGIPSGA